MYNDANDFCHSSGRDGRQLSLSWAKKRLLFEERKVLPSHWLIGWKQHLEIDSLDAKLYIMIAATFSSLAEATLANPWPCASPEACASQEFYQIPGANPMYVPRGSVCRGCLV